MFQINSTKYNSPFCSTNIFCINEGENNLTTESLLDKNVDFLTKRNELVNLFLSTYTIDNVPNNDNFGADWMLTQILLNGYICVTDKTSIGFCASPLYNVKKNAFDNICSGRPTVCDYQYGDIEPIKLLSDKNTLSIEDFELVYMNKTRTGYLNDINQRASDYARLRRLIKNNVNFKSLMAIFQGTDNLALAFDELIDIISNQDGVAKIDVAKGGRVEDWLKITTNNVEWVCDKAIELNTAQDSEFLAKIGINHIAYEKHERLITTEVETHNQLIDVVRNSIVETLNNGLEKVNKKFGYDMKARFVLNDTEKQTPQTLNNNI